MKNNVETKICKICKQKKSIEDFYVDVTGKDGRYSRCKICSRGNQKFYSKIHKKEEKLYYQKHKKEIKARDKLYRGTHKKEYLEWQRNNRDKIKAYNAKRKALKFNAPGHFTGLEWKLLKEKYGNICLCCRKKKKLTIDHIIPLSKGGTNYINNIQPLCKSCNSSKGTKTIDYRIGEK